MISIWEQLLTWITKTKNDNSFSQHFVSINNIDTLNETLSNVVSESKKLTNKRRKTIKTKSKKISKLSNKKQLRKQTQVAFNYNTQEARFICNLIIDIKYQKQLKILVGKFSVKLMIFFIFLPVIFADSDYFYIFPGCYLIAGTH